MKTNDMKDIWQSAVNQNVKSYSDPELNEMVIKSARRSMKPIQMGGWLQIVIIAIVIYVTLTLLFFDHSIERKLFDLTGLSILVVCYLLSKRSDHKMNAYHPDMPVKEWLGHRISKLKKTVYMKTRYKVLIMCLAFLSGFGIYLASYIVLKAPFNPFLTALVFVGLAIYFAIVGRSLRRKYKKTLNELEELYKQFEESD